MDLMNNIFKPYFDFILIVFIDDIHVYAISMKEYEKYLTTMIHTLREHRLFAKFSKIQLWIDYIRFLGHIVFTDGIMVDPTNIEAFHDWPKPTSVIEVFSFISLAGYYTSSIEGFITITTPRTR